jgi:hypothetical protein
MVLVSSSTAINVLNFYILIQNFLSEFTYILPYVWRRMVWELGVENTASHHFGGFFHPVKVYEPKGRISIQTVLPRIG